MSNDITSFGDLSLAEIFVVEVEAQREIMNSALISLEINPANAMELERVMRSAHSLKGAARLVNRDDIVVLAHAMEERVIAAQNSLRAITRNDIDALLAGMDIISESARHSIMSESQTENVKQIVLCLKDGLAYKSPVTNIIVDSPAINVNEVIGTATLTTSIDTHSYLRVEADHMNRLLGLASESLVQANAFSRTSKQIDEIKRIHDQIGSLLSAVSIAEQGAEDSYRRIIEELRKLVEGAELKRGQLSDEVENQSARGSVIAQRLYSEVLSGRMRPISDLHSSFAKMTRDVARALDKKVIFELKGQHTLVDREVLRQLEIPIQQMIRNAIDHGIENPSERISAGKKEAGSVIIEARGTNKTLVLKICDDGKGIDLAAIKTKILEKELSTPDLIAKMSDFELYEFMFLPGFSVRDSASEFSGRGVGLDIVLSQIRGLNGNIKVSSKPGQGTIFELHLPISMTVTKALLMEIGESLYAFPLANLVSAHRLELSEIKEILGIPTISWNGEQIGLINAANILEVPGKNLDEMSDLAVVIFKSQNEKYGLIVDDFRGQEDLVVQNIDSRFVRLRDVSATSLLHTGEIVVLLNCDDLALSVTKMAERSGISPIKVKSKTKTASKRVLVVDDSITVRELERKLLSNAGYEVQIAVDGADGWNELSSQKFDLLVTDLDMPRMNGFELVKMAKSNDRTKNIPVIIVSYKERDEDRLKGLEVGADYYLTKGSFHDESFISAVNDLVGEVDP